MKQRAWIIHPFLFAAYPVLSLLAINIDQIPARTALRPLAMFWLITAVLLLLFHLLFKNSPRAALAVSWLLFLIFSFRHVLNLLLQVLPQTAEGTLFMILFGVYLALMILGVWWMGRVLRRDLRPVTLFLNVVGAVMLALPLLTITTATARSLTTTPDPPAQTEIMAKANLDALPDIYYIIVDGYGRADVLQALYDYDNTSFLDNLRDKGFYVAENSYTNYMQTNLSLASSLNYKYLDDLATAVGTDTLDRAPLIEAVKDNAVRKFLENLGYQVIIHDSGLPSIDVASTETEARTNIDMLQMFQNRLGQRTRFENLLLSNTLFGPFLLPTDDTYAQHRQLIRHNLAATGADAAQSGPKLVITHVLAPHPPFVFAADGTPITPNYSYEVFDGSHYKGDDAQYVNGYRGQLAYLNTRLTQTIDNILAHSAQEPIIILQGDHGPGSQLNWESADESCVQERLAILNAIYLPAAAPSALYPEMSPVNTFRLIFDTYFGTELGRLPDESYFSLWNAPYAFIDVTDRRQQSCPAP